MKKAIFSTIFECFRLAIFSLVLAVNTSAFAQKQAAKGAERLVLAINEGGSGSAPATDIIFRYEEFKQVVGKALGAPVILAPVRDLKSLRDSLKTRSYSLVLLRPADIAAEAVRNYGYQWRVASAMMRDSNIFIAKEQVRIILDQAAIGWSMEGGFYDVGVVSTFSGAGRTWEKNGGRVIARSRELPNTPFIASQKISAAQIQKLRAALVTIESTESGLAILKKIGVVGGFKEAPSSQAFIDFINWLGDIEA